MECFVKPLARFTLTAAGLCCKGTVGIPFDKKYSQGNAHGKSLAGESDIRESVGVAGVTW